jgi:hypothetical protein
MRKYLFFLLTLPLHSALAAANPIDNRPSIANQNLEIPALKLAATQYQEATCPAISQYANRFFSVSQLLQSCLDRAPENSRILLEPGKYILTESVIFKKSVHLGTKGLNPLTDAPCSLNDSRCAVLLMSAPISKQPGVQGRIHITSSKVILDHLIFDGDRSNPVRQIYNLCRNTETRMQADTITADGPSLTISNSVIKNTPCSTGTEIRASSTSLTFVNNFVGPNGVHNEEAMWSDGLTVHNNAQAQVIANVFFNNTDVDLIFGGCQNCQIQKNKILHDNQFTGSSFTGLMIHSWTPEAGNYRGSLVSDNEINCGAKKRCGFGLYLGSYSWYKQPMFGGEYRNNKITNTMLGLNIDRATGPVIVAGNAIENSGGRYSTSCGMKDMPAVNISPESKANVSFSGNMSQLGFKSYEGCIPNWWPQDKM